LRPGTVVFRRRILIARRGDQLAELAAEVLREIERFDPTDDASVRSLLGTLHSSNRVATDIIHEVALVRGMRELP